MHNIEIRRANIGDENVLAYIQTESWKSAFCDILDSEELEKRTNLLYVQEMYKRVLSNSAINIYIEFVDGNPHCIAGWSKNDCNLGDSVAELICIHSLQSGWRQGFGSAMMNYVLNDIKEQGYTQVVLWVFEQNVSARRFYEKHGFQFANQTKNLRGALEMRYCKPLSQAR